MERSEDILDVSQPDCFRHPGRESAVRCQRCSRTICAECMVPAPVGFQCPECVSSAAKKVRYMGLAGAATPYITYVLIAVNVLVAIAGAADSGLAQGELGEIGFRGALIGGGIALRDGVPTFFGIDNGEWYRVFTSAFIHAGLIHLGFNMLLLWQTGSLLEPTLGRLRFGLLYTVALIGGSLGALLVVPDGMTVGASGAVFGLMGALFVMERTGRFGGRTSSVGFLIVLNLGLGFVVPGISVGGHVGGLIAGSAAGWLFQEYDRRGMSPFKPILLVAALCPTLFLACLWAASLWMDPLF